MAAESDRDGFVEMTFKPRQKGKKEPAKWRAKRVSGPEEGRSSA